MSSPFVWVSAPSSPAIGSLPNNFICVSLIWLSFRVSFRAWQVEKFAFVPDVRFLVLKLNATAERVRCVSTCTFVTGLLLSCHLPPDQIILDEFHWFGFLSGFVWEPERKPTLSGSQFAFVSVLSDTKESLTSWQVRFCITARKQLHRILDFLFWF